ncbi:MAG: hypothetical protein FJY82_06755 [Candidatus Aminicenantes bacterium]|nr:hypothetical protein [Candidatus Aminicenantes bacterium]
MSAKAKAKTKKTAKPVKKAKAAAPKKAAPALECRVCGYRVIVDRSCGCVEAHPLICCGQPMAEA